MSTHPVTRHAARLIVLDNRERVLLLQYEDHRGKWWATPGGGLKEPESFEETALREAAEELGIVDADITKLWEQEAEFPSRGQVIRQTERYFLLRADDDVLADAESAREAHGAEGIISTRWWPVAEIERAIEMVFPEDLVQRLRLANLVQ